MKLALLIVLSCLAITCRADPLQLVVDVGLAQPIYRETIGMDVIDSYGARYHLDVPVFVDGPLADVRVGVETGNTFVGYHHLSAVLDGFGGTGFDLVEVSHRFTLMRLGRGTRTAGGQRLHSAE